MTGLPGHAEAALRTGRREWPGRPARSGVQHVLMTADAVGGVWQYALTLAAALARVGVRTSLAVFTPGLPATQRAEAWNVPGLQIYEGNHRLEWMAEPWDDVARGGEWLLSLARVLRPDVVHLNGYAHAALPWPVPPVVVGHSCVASWWEAVHGTLPPPEWDRYRTEVQRGLRAAARVVAPTRAMLASLERLYGPLPPSCVVSNARAVPPVRCEKERFVLTAGRLWDEAKNVAVLAEASRRVPVRVAGEAKDPSGRERRVDGLESLDCIGRLGPEAMRLAQGRASVYAHPALYEPFGLAPLEAALQGCALVLSDIPTLRELWDGVAVFVPPRDGRAWATALETLLADEPRCRRLGALARGRAGRFRPEEQAQGMLRVYGGALVDARPGEHA